jgi:hypothetical protein
MIATSSMVDYTIFKIEMNALAVGSTTLSYYGKKDEKLFCVDDEDR